MNTPTTVEIANALNLVWTLLAGFLVFIMHLGFATVESGFTQSKNTVNIIMKNFLTICVGVLGFYVVGFGLMFGSDTFGVVGTSGFLMLGAIPEPAIPLLGFWFFQAIFAATAATIVSGAMAERTKFLAYLAFCVVITGLVYPVTGHWIWGGGWLAQLGFIDFAGSTAVHSVGGWAALVGAALVGPRIGKYVGKEVRTIPAHNIPLGAIGVLLLWFGWFGFNPGSTLSGMNPDIAKIAVTTLLAGASATVSAMFTTLFRSGKVDAGVTMNGALAGLVAITAGTQAVSPVGAIAIGLIAGVVLVYSLDLFDRVLRIDDPVGATSVHLVCGSMGTLLVGLFAEQGGLLYGGGLRLLGVQALGVAAVAGTVVVASYIAFRLIKATIGLRVSVEEEIQGLDQFEHGVAAYHNLHARPEKQYLAAAADD
ncbi:MAG TPA: ammonium transporter [Symbiobacteriaceae bacterium]|nr:ammonium transporter [Symbiobacteriaceae bacterium]